MTRETGADFVHLCEKKRGTLPGKVQTPVPMSGTGLPKLPAGWIWSSLSSVCERVSVGHVGPTSEYFSNAADSIALIRSQDVRPGRLETKACARITPAFHSSLKKSRLKAGDILIVRVGANRGDSCVVPKEVGELNCANIVFARPLFANGFFGLFTRSEFGQHLLLSATTGAAQGVINTQSVAALSVPVPPVAIQERIASILSAYDDLIENNTRRIAVLEEMARRIYEEWFVRFRFPGHENVRMVESESGPLPEGWEATTLQALYGTASGGTPSRKNSEYFSGDIPWVKTQELLDGFIFATEERITKEAIANSSAKRFPAGTVLVAMYGATIGKLGVLAVPSATNQACCAVLPQSDEFGTEYAFTALLVRRQELIDLRAGAAQQNISQVTIKNFPMVRPPQAVMGSFNELTAPVLRLWRNLQAKNVNLRETRDALLPKLIAGELDVSSLPEPEAAVA